MEEIKKRRGRPKGSLGKKKLEALGAPARPKKNKVEVSLDQQLNDAIFGLTGASEANVLSEEDDAFTAAMVEGRFAIKKPPKKKEDKWDMGTLVHYFIGDEQMNGWYCGASQAEKGCHIVKVPGMIAMMPIDHIKLGH